MFIFWSFHCLIFRTVQGGRRWKDQGTPSHGCFHHSCRQRNEQICNWHNVTHSPSGLHRYRRSVRGAAKPGDEHQHRSVGEQRGRGDDGRARDEIPVHSYSAFLRSPVTMFRPKRSNASRSPSSATGATGGGVVFNLLTITISIVALRSNQSLSRFPTRSP